MQDGLKNREEKDLLGKIKIREDSLYGIHTLRALNNFPISDQAVDSSLIKGYGYVKLAAAIINNDLGFWQDELKSKAIIQACNEMKDGLLTQHIVVDVMQGGAGTSTNMNINEVIANRALEIMNSPHGSYDIISPFDDINLHQSTNDTYPTALKIASIYEIKKLEKGLIDLKTEFEKAEKKFGDIVKVGRTQMQGAVLTTLGREMSAYADLLHRDWWRLSQSIERLRITNLGATAIGTGLGAPREYIFMVTDKLCELTGLNLCRAENLIEATQNVDIFVEVSGILRTCATNIFKIANDLRFLSSDSECGIGEIELPKRQAGSSIMADKINPVILEAVMQIAMQVMGNDLTIALAASNGNLELNPFLPLIAHNLLNSIKILTAGYKILTYKCLSKISVNQKQCQKYTRNSTTIITSLIPILGYDKSCKIAKQARETNKTIYDFIISENILPKEKLDDIISPQNVCKLGSKSEIIKKKIDDKNS